MKEKAELDILELDFSSETERFPVDIASLPEELLPQKSKNNIFKKIVPIFTALMVCIGCVWCWYHFAKQDTGAAMEKSTVVAYGNRFIYLEAFSVDLKDEYGNYRVLICDVALEMEQGREKAIKEKTELRKVVYRVIRANGVDVTRKSRKIIGRLLKDMENEANSILGQGAVKKAYFSKYTLL